MKAYSKQKAEQELKKHQEQFVEKDVHKVLINSDEIKSKFINNLKLQKYIEDFKFLLIILKDYYQGNYKAVPWYIISSIGATLLYVLTPIDSIPDFIPFVGYIDDAAVLSICLKLVHTEVEKYRKWKSAANI
jgi:uncharacterized membrane protein YkvA (DUF1232 family)